MRRRLLVWALAVLVAALAAFAVPLASVVAEAWRDRALDGLQAQVLQLGGVVDRQARTCAFAQLIVRQVADGPTGWALWTVDGRLLDATGPVGPVADEVAVAAGGGIGRTVADGRIAVAAPLDTRACGVRLVLAASRPDDEVVAEVRRTRLTIAAVGVGVLLLASLAAWLLGARFSEPLERLARSARRLGEGDFTARAPRSGLEEADAIADALDVTADRLGRAAQRSAAFTADASHQLRTPLTALRLDLEQLEAAGADPDVVADALAEVDRFATTIDELVALTRVAGVEADLALDRWVAERVVPWRARAADLGRELVVEAESVPVVRVRAAALGQAVDVLVDNALRHGRGRVTVRVATDRSGVEDVPVGARVCVVDQGGGIDPTLVEGRSRRDAGGGPLPVTGGRGLVLARTLVEAEGGRLVLGDDPEGTCVCIHVPGAQVTGARSRWDDGA